MADDTDPLGSHPFFSGPLLQPPANSEEYDLAERLLRSQRASTPTPSLTGWQKAEDVARSGVVGAAKGAAGTALGGLGSIETFVAKDLPTLARSGGLWAGEKLDLISPDRREQLEQQPLPFMSGLTPEQQRGDRAPFSDRPTYKFITENFKPYMREKGYPTLAYDPKTATGKIAETAAEYAMQGGPGSVRGAAGRMFTGAASGAGSELLAQGAKEGEDGAARVTGALVGAGVGAVGSHIGGKLFSGLKALAMPTRVSEQEFAKAWATDIRRGQTNMTLEQLQDAMDRGIPVSAMDAAGPELRKLLQQKGGLTNATEASVGSYNKGLMQRYAEAPSRFTDNLVQTMGAPIDAYGLAKAAEESGRLIRNDVYNVARAQPQAQAINHHSFSDLLDRPIFKDAMKAADVTAQNNPKYNIVSPTTIPGKPATPATPSKWVQTEKGLVEQPGTPGTPATPPRFTFGNLSYWDQVNRELRVIEDKARLGKDNTLAESAKNAREQLLRELDKVPGYTNARGVAFETLGQPDAVKAGQEFLTTMNTFRRGDLQTLFGQMSQTQKDLFAVGLAARLDDIAQKPGGLNQLSKMFTDRNTRERVELALGSDRYAQVYGSILSENLVAKTVQLPIMAQKPLHGVGAAGIGAAAAAAGTDALFMGAQVLQSPNAWKLAVAAAIGAAGKATLNAIERRAAEKLVPMAFSKDPAVIQRLGELASKSPLVAQVLNKITTGVSNAVSAYEQGRPQASGGHVGRATGGRTSLRISDRLLMAVERARRETQHETKPILNAPDETVVRALEVAKQHI